MHNKIRFPANDEHKEPRLVKTYYGSLSFLYDKIEMRRWHTLSNRHKFLKRKQKTIKL